MKTNRNIFETFKESLKDPNESDFEVVRNSDDSSEEDFDDSDKIDISDTDTDTSESVSSGNESDIESEVEMEVRANGSTSKRKRTSVDPITQKKKAAELKRYREFIKLLHQCCAIHQQAKSFFCDTEEKNNPFSDAEIDACIDKMEKEKKVMRDEDTIYIM